MFLEVMYRTRRIPFTPDFRRRPSAANQRQLRSVSPPTSFHESVASHRLHYSDTHAHSRDLQPPSHVQKATRCHIRAFGTQEDATSVHKWWLDAFCRSRESSEAISSLWTSAARAGRLTHRHYSMYRPAYVNNRSVTQRRAYMLHQTPNAPSSRSHAPDEDDVDIKELPGPSVPPKDKRSREPESEGFGAARKRLRGAPSADERRLTGDYGVPKTARPIAVPTYGSDSDHWTSQKGASMGGIRPQNTLNATPHAPKSASRDTRASQGTDFFKPNRRPIKKGQGQDKHKLTTAGSVGSNVPASQPYHGRSSNYGEGFDADFGHSAKKQKTTHNISTAGLPSDPVDLTDDDGASVTGVPNRKGIMVPPSRSPSNVVTTGKWQSASLHDGYVTKLDRTLNGRAKKPRKPKDRASQGSSQTPSVVEVNRDGHVAGEGSWRAPVCVDGDEQVVQHRIQPAAKRRQINQDGTIPPIDLDKGNEEVHKPRIDRGSKADFERSGNVLKMSNARTPSVEHVQHRKEWSSRRNGDYQPPALDTFVASQPVFGQHQQHEQESRLNRTFVRDDFMAEPHRQKATQRMQETSEKPLPSRVSPVDESFSSDDVLQGGSTVGARASRSGSPQKAQTKAGRQSPSDLLKTKFSSKGHRQPSASGRGLQQRSDDADQTNTSLEVMPIRAIFAESCVLTSDGSLSLGYDARRNSLKVFRGDVAVLLPGKQKQISLGEYEAHKVYHSRESNRVFLKGSKTEVSNGQICIAFDDHDGVAWFVDVILAVTKLRASTEHIESDRMDKLFATQAREIQKAYDKARTRTNTSALELLTGYKGQRNAVADDGEEEEEIIYEPESPQRPSARKRMLAGNENDLRASQRAPRLGVQSEASPYFTRGEVPRRSTRQTKPVHDRVPSPSPERWSKIHKPKAWSQPVVYPSQGAKRVTVEFGDLERLDEGQFLNDNIISFALRQIEETTSPEYKDSIHFFNSFFYSFLTTKNGRKEFNYDAVKRWTKNKDIFSIPYIVVPICINLHWFVAIICNLPNLSRRLAGADEIPEVSEPSKPSTPAADVEQVEEVEDSVEIAETQEHDEQSKAETRAMHKLSLSDHGDEASEHEDNAASQDCRQSTAAGHGGADEKPTAASSRQSTGSSRKSKSKKKAAPTPRRYDPDIPAIITLDSFGNPHTAEARYLKEYLKAEADDKRSMAFERDWLQGITAKGIPEQTNFCDCGVYLIGYIEQFAKDPRGFATKVLTKELDQQADFASFSPSAKRAEIREELLRLSKEQEEAHQAKKKGKKAGQGAVGKSPDKPPAQPARQEVQKAATAVHEEAPVKEASLPKLERPPPSSITEPTAPRSDMLLPEDGDDADELDVEPARPLVQRMGARNPQQIALGGEIQQSQESSGSESDNEDSNEILDDQSDHGAFEAHSAAAAPASEAPLLDGLEHRVVHGPLASETHADLAQAGDASASVPSISDEESDEEPETADTRRQQDDKPGGWDLTRGPITTF